MKFADTHTIEILEYNSWLIVKLIQNTPKLRSVGTGNVLSGFNKYDVKISDEALNILSKNIGKNLDKQDPVFEVISKDRIAWLSNNGIIIPPDELIHIWELPYHTTCDNKIDPLIIEAINKFSK